MYLVFDCSVTLADVIAVAGVAAAIVAAWIGWRATNPRRRLRYGMAVVAPLLNAGQGARDGIDRIEVRHRDRVLTDPHVLEVTLVNEGRRDIPSNTFDQDQPLTLDVSAPILEILKTAASPNRALSVVPEGTALKIGPGLIVRRQKVSFSLLVDGSAPKLTCPQPPLINIDVRYDSPPRTSLATRLTLVTAAVAAWGAEVVVVGELPFFEAEAAWITGAGVVMAVAWVVLVVTAVRAGRRR